MNRGLHLAAGAFAISLVGCASPRIGTAPAGASDPAATALLAASQEAHGERNFRRVRNLTVRYEGRWAALGPRLQPLLADTNFRRSSEEKLLLRPRTMVQVHQGPAGEKVVVRRSGSVAVTYNGQSTNNEEVRRAAALVADAYTLFLLGPFYFDRAGVTLITAGETTVDGTVCDQVLAILRPGFGFAEEDRVVLSIDRDTKQLRRVRFTLNGLESTQGAEVDVSFRDFRSIGGILWPTEFEERIRSPLKLSAHQGKTISLEINRGFDPKNPGKLR